MSNSTLERTIDFAHTATRVGLIAIAGLMIIWFTQIKPKYERLIDTDYEQLFNSYRDEYNRANERAAAERQAQLGDPSAVERRNELNRAIADIREERRDLLPTVEFDIFDLRAPVGALSAGLVWQTLLLAVLAYVARSRYVFWSKWQRARARQDSGDDSVDDLTWFAEPMWVAPPPRVIRSEPCSTTDRAEPAAVENAKGSTLLPSARVRIAFVLIVLVQFDVLRHSLRLLEVAARFSGDVQRLLEAGLPRVEAEIANVTIGLQWAAVETACHVLAAAATVWIAVVWFRPWRSADANASLLSPAVARGMLIGSLVGIAVITLSAAIASPVLRLSLSLVPLISRAFPALVGAAAAVVVVELVVIAMQDRRRERQVTAADAGDTSIASDLLPQAHDMAQESRPGTPGVPPPEQPDVRTTARSVWHTPTSWTRREALVMAIGAGLASAAAEISAALTRTSQQVVSAARAAAPLLRPLRILWQQTNRNPGFHALPQPPSATRWPRARVTHYVDDRSRLLYAGFLNPTLLETVDLPTLVNGFDPPGPLRRANLGRSSVIFELEALRRVRESHQRNDPSLIDEACRCLILGIRHDLKYKSERSVPVPPPARAIGLRRPSRTPGARLPRPSLRLFDLLARLSVLHDRPEHMKTLEQLVEQVGVLTDKERRLAPVRRRGVDALASRLEQWKRPDSLWSQTVRANRTWRVVRPMEEASADGQPARRYATWNDEYQL